MDLLKTIFGYSPDSPMIFTALYFWAYFAVVMAVYSLVYKKNVIKHIYLFTVSTFFYWKTSGFFVFLLLFATVVDYNLAASIFRTKDDESLKRKLLLTLSVVMNIGVLCYFKYSNFLVGTINSIFGTHFQVMDIFAKWINDLTGTHFRIEKIFLPIGISFYTFQTLSYTIDVYRKKLTPARSLIDFSFFVMFFPQLVAGPIVRAVDFLPQIYREYKLSKEDFGYALFLILSGLMKKMFISDYISVNFIDRIFDNPMTYTGFEVVMALFGYSLQVYTDFSGYTDIATGVALLMGYELTKNFNSPYKALNPAEFWGRWHMSLSTWLRDYLYIPLGGNRGGATRTNVNLMLTMLIGGLWHGSSWQFVIWGGLNGVAVVVAKFWNRVTPFKNDNSWAVRAWAIFMTFSFISFTRIWFRSPTMDTVNNIMYQLGHSFDFSLIPKMIVSYKAVFSVILLGLVIHWLSADFKEKYKTWFINTPIYVKALIAVVVVFIIYQAKSADLQPFIYFQF